VAELKHPTEQDLLAKLDSLTKQGQRLQVLKELSRLLKAGPARTLRPQLARLANRNHAYVLALRILHPIIREDREKTAEAGSEALNIYATSLMWIGALEEAQDCLHRIHGSTDALLTEAFVHFARWDYEKSMPLLLKYVNSPATSSYQKLVGQTNLLAALIAVGNLKQAKEVFSTLETELSTTPHYTLLYGNCLELRSQIEILENSYESALGYLTESEKCLSDQPGRYLLYVNKWRALAQLALNPKDPAVQQSILKVKAEAAHLKNWETLRDCDFHEARLSQNQELLQRILLGTPYQGYHSRVHSLFGISVQESKTLSFCPTQAAITPERVGLDLNAITETSFLNSTSWPLIQVMTKDIYRPPRMGVVFSGLYKGEYFDPFTSPQRVRNSVFRFNDWALENHCEFRIRIESGDFQLVGPEGLGVRSTQRERQLGGWQAALKVFKLQNDSRSFTTADLADVLGITPRNALSIVQKALSSKKIQKLGAGKNSRYIFFSGRRRAA
jgi:tetratricopeptide (TPR) repeat protein